MLHIGFLIFPRIQQLDLTAPYEVFASLPDVTVHLVWKTREPVMSVTGLSFTPTNTFTDCPALDVICVPGGAGINDLLSDGETLGFLRRQARGARYVTSVCTGSLVLGAAGLLRGRRAATHWASMPFLEQLGAIPVDARVVQDGNIITAGGVTSGIDFALTLTAELLGVEAAQTVQLQLEYNPSPPFHSGHPSSAPAEVLAKVREKLASTIAARQALIDRLKSNPNT